MDTGSTVAIPVTCTHTCKPGTDGNSAQQVPAALATVPEEVELPDSDMGSDVVEIIEGWQVRDSVKWALSMFAGMDSEGEEFENESDDNNLDTDLESDESNPMQLDLGGHDWAEDKTIHSRRKVSVKSAKVKLLLKGKAQKMVDELDLSDSPSVCWQCRYVSLS